jgi:hypothetical protein
MLKAAVSERPAAHGTRSAEMEKSSEEDMNGVVGCANAALTYGWERTSDPKGASIF